MQNAALALFVLGVTSSLGASIGPGDAPGLAVLSDLTADPMCGDQPMSLCGDAPISVEPSPAPVIIDPSTVPAATGGGGSTTDLCDELSADGKNITSASYYKVADGLNDGFPASCATCIGLPPAANMSVAECNAKLATCPANVTTGQCDPVSPSPSAPSAPSSSFETEVLSTLNSMLSELQAIHGLMEPSLHRRRHA